jgi:hypothetical protein
VRARTARGTRVCDGALLERLVMDDLATGAIWGDGSRGGASVCRQTVVQDAQSHNGLCR